MIQIYKQRVCFFLYSTCSSSHSFPAYGRIFHGEQTDEEKAHEKQRCQEEDILLFDTSFLACGFG